jgi:outer membrane protein TolC
VLLAAHVFATAEQPEWRAVSPSGKDATGQLAQPAAPTAIAPAQALSAPCVPETPAAPSVLSLEEAVRYALANNPQLAVIRNQHGLAAAAVVIARTYPYNPIWQSTVAGDSGPASAGITNSVFNASKITLDLEIRGQRAYRRQAAFAALSRTDWEIAAQEVVFAATTVRAFDAMLYRQGKLALTEEFLKLNQKAAAQVKELVDRGTLRPADLILARAEVNDVQSQIGLHRTALVAARRDLARALGGADLTAVPQGTLERTAPAIGAEELLTLAFEHRPDLFARRTAVTEAEARLKLQIADRFGNPTIGPMYELNETSVNFFGMQIGGPIPVFNRKQGEIKLREAERMQALLNVRQIETEIHQDVLAALGRVDEARNWAQKYRQEILPDLRKSLDEMDKLFQQGQPGVDVLRLLDVRRKLLRAQDGYFDALLAYTQALAELAAAVGDPALAMGLYQAPEAAPKP